MVSIGTGGYIHSESSIIQFEAFIVYSISQTVGAPSIAETVAAR